MRLLYISFNLKYKIPIFDEFQNIPCCILSKLGLTNKLACFLEGNNLN